MFTTGRQTKYVYPSLFFLLLLLIMLLRMTVAGAEEGAAMMPAGGAHILAFGGAAPHSEADFINAVNEFNAAINPRSERDRETQDVLLLAGREDRVRDLQRNWRRTNGSFFTGENPAQADAGRNYGTAYGDQRYSEARNRLDQRRNKELDVYREKRREMEKRMMGYNRESEEYELLARQLQDLDRSYISRENNYGRQYSDLDMSFALRSH